MMNSLKIFFLLLFLSQYGIAQQKNIKTFFNKTYKYELSYPSSLAINNDFDDEVYLDNQKTHLILRILDVDELFNEYKSYNAISPSGDKFLDVLLYHAVTISNADGPDGSVYIENPLIADEFELKNGLRVVKYYADLITENFKTKTKKQGKAGPFYGIKLNEKFSLYITFNYGLELASKEIEQLLENIVKSVTIRR